MGFLTDWLTDWLKELLIDGIMGNLTGFSIRSIQGRRDRRAGGHDPGGWNAGVFSMIRQLSETVICRLPVSSSPLYDL